VPPIFPFDASQIKKCLLLPLTSILSPEGRRNNLLIFSLTVRKGNPPTLFPNLGEV
jgi:hypothetical protein